MSTPALTEAMKIRAVEIADESMTELLRCTAVPGLGLNEFSLCDDAGKEVAQLADAANAILEAWDWLSQRGLAVLREDEHGQIIALVTRT